MKLLLIMPRFFDYPEIIIEELNNMGYKVDFFDDRPSSNGWVKAIIRINKDIIKQYIQKYFNVMMEKIIRSKYDVVFLISGQSLSLSEEMIKQIKDCQPQARFFLYQWDSHKNFPYIKSFQKYFDKCYSFDKYDVANNDRLKFLPLFYCKRYEEIGKQRLSEFKYDFCFVGTAHPKKYKFINMMSLQLKKVYPNQFIYFFFPSRLVYFYRKLKNAELRKSHYKEFHYTPLNGKEMDELYLNSRCVMDSPQAGQLGLTIRVIEALGARKKIITTNTDIIHYDFYKPENIYVYKDCIDLNHVFFKKSYVDIDEEIYAKYSLRNWLTEILNEEDSNHHMSALKNE